MALPINHLKRTLDRCCGQWEFDRCEPTEFKVRFLNTARIYCIEIDNGHWTAFMQTKPGYYERCPRLSGILNGLKRNDSGHLPADFNCVPGVE